MADWISILFWQAYLPKTRNNLKRPETTYKEQEAAAMSKEWLETTWNDLQIARNDLKRTAANKKRPEATWNDL